MSLLLAAAVFGGCILATALTWRLLRGPAVEPEPRRWTGDRYVDAPGFPPPLPRRDPGAAEARIGHLQAVWAQCTVSEPYVAAMLAEFEPEVTGLLELALELDDQSPRTPDDGDRGYTAQ